MSVCASERDQGKNSSVVTHLFVSLLLPLGNQTAVRVAVLQKPVVELLGYGLFVIEKLVDVPAPCTHPRHERTSHLGSKEVHHLL